MILLFLLNRLDNSNSDSLLHISDGKSSKRRVLGKGLDNHRLGWDEVNHGRVSSLDRGRLLLHGFSCSLIDELENLLELASNVAGMAVKDRRVSVADLTWMLHNDDLSVERDTSLGRILLAIRGNASSLDFLDGKSFDVETNIISRIGSLELSVMLLNGLDI